MVRLGVNGYSVQMENNEFRRASTSFSTTSNGNRLMMILLPTSAFEPDAPFAFGFQAGAGWAEGFPRIFCL